MAAAVACSRARLGASTSFRGEHDPCLSAGSEATPDFLISDLSGAYPPGCGAAVSRRGCPSSTNRASSRLSVQGCFFEPTGKSGWSR